MNINYIKYEPQEIETCDASRVKQEERSVLDSNNDDDGKNGTSVLFYYLVDKGCEPLYVGIRFVILNENLTEKYLSFAKRKCNILHDNIFHLTYILN